MLPEWRKINLHFFMILCLGPIIMSKYNSMLYLICFKHFTVKESH